MKPSGIVRKEWQSKDARKLDGTTKYASRKLTVSRPLGVRVRGGSDVMTEVSHQGKLRRTQPNTYRTEPDDDGKFIPSKVEYIIKFILEAHLRKVKYEPAFCGKLAHDLCAMIKNKTKELNFPRYKLVAHVIIGQDTDQSVQIASQCLWDANVDAYAAATYRNESLYAVGMVFGMYLE